MTTDFPTGASQEPLACCDTAFSCLLRLGVRSGAVPDIEAARRRSVVDEDTLPVSRLIALADELGLKAEQAQLDWQDLRVVGQSHPILVLLKDTNVAIVTAGERGEEDIAVWDPLHRHGKTLFVPREDFEKAWTGHALIITNQAANTPATAASAGFCWYTSAGLELLGKAGARGQLSNPPNRPRAVGENRHKPDRRRERRQSADVSDMRAEPVSAPPGTAKAQSSSVPMGIVEPSSPESPRGADTGWLVGIARLCLAAAGIAAVVGIVGFLLRGGGIDMVRAAVTRATEVPVNPPRAAIPTRAALPTQAAAIPTAPAEGGGTPNAMPPLAPVGVTAPTVAAPSVGQSGITDPAPASGEVGAGAATMPAGPPPAAAPSSATAAPAAASGEVEPQAAATPAAGPSGTTAAPAAASDEVGPHAAATPAAGPSGTTAAPAAASDEVGPHAAAPPAGPPPATAPSVATAAPAAASGEAGPHAVAAGLPTEALSGNKPAPAASSETAAASVVGSASETPPDSAATGATPVAAAPPAEPQLSAAELATLLARGDALVSIGDVASARLFYERAANAGDALAAVRLGETFDPGFLERARLRAVRPDLHAAVSWYRRARDLGVPDAEILLKSLESQ